MRSSLILSALLLAGCTATPSVPRASAPEPKLRIERFGSVPDQDVRTLVIVLHGDGDTRSDHYRFAEAAAAALPASAAIALLRPGYADRAGGLSPGDRGADTGDNYAPAHVAAVGEAITAVRSRYPGARAIVVGDAGGAAIAANLAGLRPGLFDGMVLVGCPCALPEWRGHMARQTANAAWRASVTSLDPLKTAGGVAASLRAVVLVGSADKVTPPRLSKAYAEALALRGIATDYRIVPGKGHELLNDAEVLAAASRLADALGTP